MSQAERLGRTTGRKTGIRRGGRCHQRAHCFWRHLFGAGSAGSASLHVMLGVRTWFAKCSLTGPGPRRSASLRRKRWTRQSALHLSPAPGLAQPNPGSRGARLPRWKTRGVVDERRSHFGRTPPGGKTAVAQQRGRRPPPILAARDSPSRWRGRPRVGSGSGPPVRRRYAETRVQPQFGQNAARRQNSRSSATRFSPCSPPRMLAGMLVRVLSPTQSAPDDERKSLTGGVFRVTKVMQDANNPLVELKVRHDGDSLYKVALPADEVQTVRSKQRNRAFDYMLEFFETLFSGFPPLVFRCAEEPTSPVLMYTDASRSPTLRRTRSRSHRHSVQSSLHIRSAGKVWLFVDNTAAISATAHGYTASPFLGPLSNAVQFALAFLRCDLRREYVPTDTNPADIPSRDPAERSEKCKQVLVDIKVSKPDSNRRMVLPRSQTS